jgi:hypothetical protein
MPARIWRSLLTVFAFNDLLLGDWKKEDSRHNNDGPCPETNRHFIHVAEKTKDIMMPYTGSRLVIRATRKAESSRITDTPAT